MASPRFDLTTFGEVMLRLSVPAGQRLELASRLDVFPAGAEGNTAGALARLGRSCGIVTALPAHAPGRFIANQLRMAGVDLGGVVWSPAGRVGTFFVEFSEPPRATEVIYDRSGSAITELAPAQVNWQYLLDTRLLYLTGITPPLAPGCLEIVRLALARARAASIPIAFDINYRQKLWPAADAAETLRALIQGVDLLFCSARDAERLFCISGPPDAAARGLADLSRAHNIVLTLGERGAVAWDGERLLHEPAPPTHILDRIGAGDALAAGVIHGWLDGTLARGLRFGVIMAGLALTQYGDMVVTNAEELEALAQQPASSLIR